MRFSKAVVKYRIPILILTVLLMIPAVIGIANTRINYDMLNYLPEDMDSGYNNQNSRQAKTAHPLWNRGWAWPESAFVGFAWTDSHHWQAPSGKQNRTVVTAANQRAESCAGSQRRFDRPEAQSDDTVLLSHLCWEFLQHRCLLFEQSRSIQNRERNLYLLQSAQGGLTILWERNRILIFFKKNPAHYYRKEVTIDYGKTDYS